MNKKKYVYSNNCSLWVSKTGLVELLPTPHFTHIDLRLAGEVAIQRAKELKYRMPEMSNKWWAIPTLTEAV